MYEPGLPIGRFGSKNCRCLPGSDLPGRISTQDPGRRTDPRKSLTRTAACPILKLQQRRCTQSSEIASNTDRKVPMAVENGFSSRIDREIFNTGLSMETISLYLLCCGLIDAGATPTLEMLRSRWNDSDEAFQECLNELLGKGILRRLSGADAGQDEFRPEERARWRL